MHFDLENLKKKKKRKKILTNLSINLSVRLLVFLRQKIFIFCSLPSVTEARCNMDIPTIH